MRQGIRSHLTYANVAATLSLFIVLGGTAYAATGGNLILGKPNTAANTTSLSAPVSGKALQVTNTGTVASSTALGLNVASGHPPFTVNSGAKVTNLNADTLDGLDSTALVNQCPSGTSKFGRICAESDGTGEDWVPAMNRCSDLGLRVPSTSEAVTLARNYDVPGVSGTEKFWTADFAGGQNFQVIAVDEAGAVTFENWVGAYPQVRTVCVD